MLIRKKDDNGIIDALYESSNVLASKYNMSTNDLTITFKSGLVYTYKDVPIRDYTRLEIAESQGKVINSVIKKYTFEKGESVHTDTILAEIDDNKNMELKALEDDIINHMSSSKEFYSKNNKLNDSHIDSLISLFEKYKEIKK